MSEICCIHRELPATSLRGPPRANIVRVASLFSINEGQALRVLKS